MKFPIVWGSFDMHNVSGVAESTQETSDVSNVALRQCTVFITLIHTMKIFWKYL